MSLSREDVEDILKVLDSTSYDELHLETDRYVLRLRREAGGWTEEHGVRGEPRTLDEPGRGEGAPVPAVEPDGDGESHEIAREGFHAVLSPLPGIFYRAPKPGEPPFVEVGDHVGPETVVAILETMKLMNPVRAGASGTVADFAVANDEAIGQGVVLVWLAPDET